MIVEQRFPKRGPDSREEFLVTERLSDIVIGSGLQSLHDGVLVGLGREYQHGFAGIAGSKGPEELKPVPVRQSKVQDDQIKRRLLALARRLEAPDPIHLIP